MPKLRVLSGEKVCGILTLHGFAEVRQKGSHIFMQKKNLLATGKHETITVPVPNHKELRPGTLSAIIRLSRVDREAFE